MDLKQKGINIANETLGIFKQGFYKTRKGMVKVKELEDYTVLNTILYTPENAEELTKKISITGETDAAIEITSESTLQASKRLLDEGYNNVACLNFASAKHPGGGFLSGSYAQEESLARASGLYPSISLKKEMYEYNIKQGSPLYSDYMIYSPKVPVIRDDNFNLLDIPYCISIITSPSVNYGAIKDKSELAQVESVMRKRIEKVLALSVEHNDEAIVLGGFGCGVFRMNPVDVANYFKDALLQKGYSKTFKKVVFAIYGRGKNYEAFEKVFKQ